MNPLRIGLFDLARDRLHWNEQRQAVLARNIANISTPAYEAKDLPSFAKTLARFDAASPVRTQPNHLGRTGDHGIRPITDRATARSPDGNSVALEAQLTKVADTETTQSLVTTIYKKYMGLFGMALGKV
ncbi:MAG: flagellar basal body rod protein FlgB [Acetobacteraceae bacterium]